MYKTGEILVNHRFASGVSSYFFALIINWVNCSYYRGGTLVYAVCWWYCIGRWIERWLECKTIQKLNLKALLISCTKVEYVNCNFSWNVQRTRTLTRIEAQEILQSYSPRYLGTIINKDVEYRIRVGWLKWRLAYGVLWDLCIPTRLSTWQSWDQQWLMTEIVGQSKSIIATKWVQQRLECRDRWVVKLGKIG